MNVPQFIHSPVGGHSCFLFLAMATVYVNAWNMSSAVLSVGHCLLLVRNILSAKVCGFVPPVFLITL